VKLRGKVEYETRDNVIFEFGLFLTALGTSRTFFLRADETGPDFHVLTDVGRSATTPRFKFRVRADGQVMVDRESLHAAAKQIADEIVKDIKKREKERDNRIQAHQRLEARLRTYDGTVGDLVVNHASDTRLLNTAGEYIKELLALKAAAVGRSVEHAVRDLSIYFHMVDDLLDITQLAEKQKNAPNNKIKEVWVFADHPLEFGGPAGEAAQHLRALRDTIAHNLKQDVR
jgi:hypothetical protein